jgi:hypothetical protein
MLAGWEREHPGRVDAIFTALCNVATSHLADPAVFDFVSLRIEEGLDPTLSPDGSHPSGDRVGSDPS